jgi:thiol-disulfide isomerase/thioredoxin
VAAVAITWSKIRNMAITLAALTLAGCGALAHSAAPSASQIAADFKGAPAPLAALHDQANELLGGGASAFDAELRALRGYPVVVNKWASWCGPCRDEFPIFQRVAPQLGRRVAFLGDDVNDTTAAGKAWLRSFPVSYPSFADPSGAINNALGLDYASGTPVTYFYNAAGRLLYTHLGPYLSAASLRLDIRSYLGA